MPAISETIISLEDITCSFNVRQSLFKVKLFNVLKGITLSIYQGETLGIIGRNGAGKSTLLKVISGVLKADTGKVIYHQPLSASLLTMQLGFSPEISGRLNAILGAMLLGYSKKEAMEKLDDIIAYAEAQKWIDDPFRTYSAGMRARLGFAVSMEMSPDVLLIDEALGVGDASFRSKSTRDIKKKILSGQTVVFVSHSEPDLKELCTRLAWTDDGRIKKVGEAQDVINAYRKFLEHNHLSARAR